LIRWLWDDLRDLFDTDDGSLPEIRVNYSDCSATVAGYALLRERAARIVSERASLWSNTQSTSLPVDSVPNAAALVVSGEAASFHVVLGGIQSQGVTIPDLGVFVFSDQLALDYRMGPDWGARELRALFALLAELAALDPQASVSHWDTDAADRFKASWRRWAAEHVADNRLG
jgi:hypothetical protein